MRRNLGVLLQGNGLLTDLSVAENVALPLRAHTRMPEPLLQRLVLMKLTQLAYEPSPKRCHVSYQAEWRGAWRWHVRWLWIRH